LNYAQLQRIRGNTHPEDVARACQISHAPRESSRACTRDAARQENTHCGGSAKHTHTHTRGGKVENQSTGLCAAAGLTKNAHTFLPSCATTTTATLANNSSKPVLIVVVVLVVVLVVLVSMTQTTNHKHTHFDV